MTTLIAPDELRLPAVDAPGAPRLRVRRAGRVEQTVPLDAGKLTIGSSPRCQIRLPAEDARPLQCVVSLETGVAVATRWAEGVLLNGLAFSKQELHPGDRLAIGPWEMEWDSSATELTTTLAEDIGEGTPSSAPPRRPAAVTELIPQSSAPLAKTPKSQSQAIEALSDPPPASPPQAQLRRPAAKTQLVASRKTDSFDQPLGPSPPPLAETPPSDRPPHPSQEFEDRLVVDLWAANFTARSRVKALVAAARAARDRAGKLATAIEAFEVQLLAVRSAHDTESAERRNQLDALRAELIQSISDRDALDADLQLLRAATENAAGDHAAELNSVREEVQRAVADRDQASADLERVAAERDRVASDLQVVAAERDRLAGDLYSHRAKFERQAAEQAAGLQSARAEVQHAVAERDRMAADLEFITAERDRLTGDLHQLRTATDRQALEQSANLEATNAELQIAIAEREKLGAKLELAVAERGRLAAEFNDFRAEADRLSAEAAAALDAARRDSTAGAADRDRLTADLNELRAESNRQSAARTAELEALRGELERAIADRERISAELQAATTERNRVAEELDAIHAALRRTAPPDPRLQTLAEARAVAEGEARRLREQIAACSEQLSACESQIASLQEQAAAAEQTRRGLEEQLAALTSERASWIGEREALVRDRAAVDEEAAQLRGELTSLKSHCEQLEHRADAAEATGRELGEQLAAWDARSVEWQAERQELQRNRVAVAEEAAKLRDEVAARIGDVEQLEQRLAEAEEARRVASEQLAAWEAQSAQGQAERDGLARERNDFEQESVRLRDELTACRAQIEQLEQHVAANAEVRHSLDEQLLAHDGQHVEWQSERQELQSQRTAAEEVSVQLRDELAASETHIERLQEQVAAADAARAELDQRLADQQRLQEQWLAGCQTLERNHAAAVAEVTAERDRLQQRLDELANQSARQTPIAAARLDEESPVADEPTPPVAAVELMPDEPSPSEASFGPTSFIDRYRHLLDDEGADADAMSEPSRLSRPILDDEYLSPAKAPAGGGDEDSDEALEAYMSNMMRRVRSSTPSVGASHAFQVVEPNADSNWSTPLPEAPAIEAIEMEVDANGMERPVRKQPITTDLSALRDLANASARTAIADYRQRLHVESTVTKAIVCAVSLAAAPYFLGRATDFASLWFWSGSAALVVAAGAGILLVRMFWQRMLDRLRNSSASMPAKLSDAATTLAAAPLAEGVALVESLD